MSSALTSRIATEFAAAARESAAPATSLNQERRRKALEALTAQGLPTSRDENWKYLNLRSLEKVRFVPANRQQAVPISVADLPPTVASYARYTFVDGVFAPALSSSANNSGVTVSPLAQTATPLRPRISGPESDALPADLRFALLNDVFATDGAVVRVAPGTDCPACLELLFVASSDGKSAASYPRVELQIGKAARVGLIERHISIGSDANFVNGAVNMEIGRDAIVSHYRVQQTGLRAVYFDTLTATLAENANYQLYTVSLGAQSGRSTVHVQLAGERAEIGLHAAAVGSKAQVHDTFALIEHIAPNTRTEQNFRGIASGRARVAFNGKIVVRPTARGTDSRQSLRGLLAGADAEIDVRPQLEIYTDDVRCSHGATAGKLDENMLFYLLSRGLERETAMRVLKWAFLEDVVSKIGVPELRRQIEQSLAGQLNETAALKEFL